MNRMPEPRVESISVDEFLTRFDEANIHTKTQVRQMFEVAAERLKRICSPEWRPEGPPIIRIRIAPGLQAEGNHYAIYINEDLVNYYLNLSKPPVFEVIPELIDEDHHFDDPFYSATMAFTWMVLHELYHSRREHNAVVGEVGASKETLLAIEMDADMMATAIIYRHLQHRYEGFHGDLIIRKLALTFIFWGFRGLPEPEGDDSHASSLTRILMITTKLILLRRVQEDPPDPDFKTAESRSNSEPLMQCYKNCELIFLTIKSIEPSFIKNKEYPFSDIMSITVRWDEIRDVVSRHSKTRT